MDGLPTVGDEVFWVETEQWPYQKVYGPATVLRLDFYYCILQQLNDKLREISHERIFASKDKALDAANEIQYQCIELYELVSESNPYRKGGY